MNESTTRSCDYLISSLNFMFFYVKIIHIKSECESMKISYKKLWILLISREISAVDFRQHLNISSGTMTKLRRNEEVALSILLKICDYLDCNIGDICEAVK